MVLVVRCRRERGRDDVHFHPLMRVDSDRWTGPRASSTTPCSYDERRIKLPLVMRYRLVLLVPHDGLALVPVDLTLRVVLRRRRRNRQRRGGLLDGKVLLLDWSRNRRFLLLLVPRIDHDRRRSHERIELEILRKKKGKRCQDRGATQYVSGTQQLTFGTPLPARLSSGR